MTSQGKAPSRKLTWADDDTFSVCKSSLNRLPGKSSSSHKNLTSLILQSPQHPFFFCISEWATQSPLLTLSFPAQLDALLTLSSYPNPETSADMIRTSLSRIQGFGVYIYPISFQNVKAKTIVLITLTSLLVIHFHSSGLRSEIMYA
jgi:hypothetical protein